MVRRSTPYAFHDGTVGLYFMGFCRTQAPMRGRKDAMYGINGQDLDAITAYSTPASGSFYFAPSVEAPGRGFGLSPPRSDPGPGRRLRTRETVGG